MQSQSGWLDRCWPAYKVSLLLQQVLVGLPLLSTVTRGEIAPAFTMTMGAMILAGPASHVLLARLRLRRRGREGRRGAAICAWFRRSRRQESMDAAVATIAISEQ